MALQTSFTFRFADVEVHEPELRVMRSGETLAVEPKAFRVLIYLLRHAGHLVPKEELLAAVWGDTAVTDNSLTRAIALLRRLLDDDPHNPRYIETVSTAGYRFICPVESESGEAAESGTATIGSTNNEPPGPQNDQQHSGKKRWIVSAAAGIAVAGAAGFVWYAIRPLPAPHISHYEQLTLDGRQKFPFGTDGTRIYLDLPGGRRIGQVPVSGGKVTEIPIDVPLGDWYSPGLHVLSPNASSLLVMNQFSAEGYKVWVVGALGQPARYLTRALRATWSPDGKTIIYTSINGDIYTVSANGGAPRLLHRVDVPVSVMTRTRDMSMSPDGTTIRLSRWGGKMYEVSSTGSNFHEWLPGWNGSVQKCCGRWTPDGQFFIFLAGRTLGKSPSFPRLAQIWAIDERHEKMRPRIAKPILLASDPLLWGDAVPSRDGRNIFARGVSLRGELERYDPVSKRLEPYLGGISSEMPNFSHDGKYVAYISFPEGILWRANRDGSAQMQLTEPPFYPRNPRWSPDGSEILFTDNTQTGVDAIYVVSSQGGIPKLLLPESGEPQTLADWSPDGKRVIYSTHPAFSSMPYDESKVETRIVDLASGRVTPLTKGRDFFATYWSPDGERIVGQSGTSELDVYDLGTGKWNTLVQNVEIGYHNWSQDGRFIYFAQWMKDKVGVYRIRPQGGTPELVFELPETFRCTGFYGFWMSLDPDDAPLIFRDVGTDEIYALTLERK